MSAAVAYAPAIVNRGVHLHPLSFADAAAVFFRCSCKHGIFIATRANNAPPKALVGASLKGYLLHCIIFRMATEPCAGS